ncbi:MAG: alanine racemase [Thermodesulfobacteriota bacterium]
MQNQIWLEIDLQAIAHNCRQVRSFIPADTSFMAVVKANAYGHGDIQVARTVLQNGADCLAVARLQEGIRLRQAGITAPILVFGPVSLEDIPQLLEHDLMLTLYDADLASNISKKAEYLGTRIKGHIKIDTGMGRLGLNSLPEDKSSQTYDYSALQNVIRLATLPGLEIKGLFTHFAQADNPDKSYTLEQLHRFLHFATDLKFQDINIPLLHAANSAATIDLPESHLGMVRPGIMLYGFYPTPHQNKTILDLIPAMTFKTRIIQIKDVPAGFRVSYGSTYTTTAPTRLATLSVGYADGYPRILSSRGEMLIRGRRVPVVGRVCMDQTVVDIGRTEDIQPGEEVTIFGKQGDVLLPVEEIADACSTIHYEIVSSIPGRVPRIYYPQEEDQSS